MVIGYDAKRLFCNQRGLGNYSRDLIRILSSYYPENTYHLYTPEIKIEVNINKKNTSVIQPNGIYSVLPKALWRSFGMTNQIVKNEDQIYHGLSQELPYGIEKTTVRKVITFHDAIFMRYPELYSPSYRAIFIQKNKFACRTADRIIAISQQTKRDIIEFFDADEKKIDIVYQGCNNIFRTKIDEDIKNRVKEKYNLPERYLLNVGAIEKRKNSAQIIEALYSQKIDIPLVIVGKPTDYIKELKSLICKYKMGSQVLFIHDADTPDLPAIYNMAEIFIYTSIFEGFGIPILEALNSGTPVISSTGSCFEETGGDRSCYVHPESPDELAHAIIGILNNKIVRREMIDEGLKYATKFNDVSIANELMNVYKKLK